MFLVNQKPFVTFDQFIDTQSLATMRPLVSCFLAKNNHLIKPTMYVQGNFSSDNNAIGIMDYLKTWENDFGGNEVLKTKIQELVNLDKFAHFAAFEKDVTAGPFSMVTRWPRHYSKKHLQTECVALPEDQQLDFLYDWIEKQRIFSDFGRVTFFINYPGSSTSCHRDHSVPTAVPDEFISINFFPNQKQLWVLDPGTQQKIYVKGECYWFNTNNYHGTDPVASACYTLRIDGVFSDQFRERALLT